MVPEPVSESTGTPAAEIVLRRVGPGQPGAAVGEFSTAMAADSYLASTLVTLWHKVSEAGGAVGFVPPVVRSQVARVAAKAISDVRDGNLRAVALTHGRDLAGIAFLESGRPDSITGHTGEITTVMVDPDLQGTGLGSRLMTAVLDLAREVGLERVSLTARDGLGLEDFYKKFGFVEYGRRPGWLRLSPSDNRDEILLWADLSD